MVVSVKYVWMNVNMFNLNPMANGDLVRCVYSDKTSQTLLVTKENTKANTKVNHVKHLTIYHLDR